jgi:hypothetical protein
MEKTVAYYRQAFTTLEKRAREALDLSSAFARKIAYFIKEELVAEDFDKYKSSQHILGELPDGVTAKDLIDMAIHRFDFSPDEIDEFVFLGIVADELETFIKMFLDLGFIKRVSEDNALSSKLDGVIWEGVHEIINREALVMVIAYMKAMKEVCTFEESAEDWKYPSLKPYAIQAMFFGRKLGDCVAKVIN